MSGISISVTGGTAQTQGLDNGAPIDQKDTPKKPEFTVSILIDPDGETGPMQGTTLQFPLIGLEDINASELEQILETVLSGHLQNTPWAALAVAGATIALNDVMGQLGALLAGKLGGSEAEALQFLQDNQAALVTAFSQMETAATQTVGSLLAMIENSQYPDHRDFLKLLLEVAQNMRELASEARQAAVRGEFDNLLAQSEMLMTKAEKNYESTMKEIEAARTEAITQIVTGAVSLVISCVGLGTGNQLVGPLATALSSIGTGIGGLVAADQRTTAAETKKEAEQLDALLKQMDAIQSMIRNDKSIAEEIQELAKTLKDFVLKMMQDFISSQQQVVQRANV